MAYAQRNYNEFQGINGKFRIAQIGCFLVSFANLLDRFGRAIDPLDLNRNFRDGNIYIDVDDGIKDDLAWTSISKFNSNIVVTGTGTGIPPHSNAIVKFNNLKNNWGTHFCLVADVAKGLIVDSWDGQVKSWNVYGGPKTWATYEDRTPAPVQPSAPVSAPVVAPQAPQPAPQPETVDIKIQSGWGLSHALKAVGYNKQQWENPAEWTRLSALNGAPAGLRLKVGQVIKVYKTPLTIEPPTPVPVPAPVPAPVQPVEASQPVVTPPPVEVVEVPTPEVKPVDLKEYKLSATPINKIFISKETVIVKDLDGLHMDRQLLKGQKVIGAQSFIKDGKQYIRTKRSIEDNKWYGVPVEVLSDGQNPETYVGPLIPEDDSMFNLDMAREAREMLNSLSGREKIVAFIAKLQGFFLRILMLLKIKK